MKLWIELYGGHCMVRAPIHTFVSFSRVRKTQSRTLIYEGAAERMNFDGCVSSTDGRE
jgi:hypothetical protein